MSAADPCTESDIESNKACATMAASYQITRRSETRIPSPIEPHGRQIELRQSRRGTPSLVGRVGVGDRAVLLRSATSDDPHPQTPPHKEEGRYSWHLRALEPSEP